MKQLKMIRLGVLPANSCSDVLAYDSLPPTPPIIFICVKCDSSQGELTPIDLSVIWTP